MGSDNVKAKSSQKKRKKIQGLIPIAKPLSSKKICNKTLKPVSKANKAEIFRARQTVGTILCSKCGIQMQPNAAYTCVKCLQSEFKITEGLQKHVILMHCPKCESYLQPPRTWTKFQLESKELLAFCLKRLNFFHNVKLAHADFIWTEPHSKRIKVKLNVRKEVLNGVILGQSYTVEYVLTDHTCESCSRVHASPDQWVASVQLRQHVSHRRTFFYLEQLILKHGEAFRAIKVKQMGEGVDFLFANKNHASKFVEFVQRVVPTKKREAKELLSHDPKSNIYDYKYTFSVEICPICSDDLICLPPKVASSLGHLGPLVLCIKVTNNILLLDPATLRHVSIDAEQYWRAPFKPLLSCKQLVEYMVLNVMTLNVGSSRYALAEVEVARVSDYRKFTASTHLGNILKPGDYVRGYDIHGATANDMELDKYKTRVLPDVILIKKSYEERRRKTRGKPRPWKLKSINMEVDPSSRRRDEEKMNREYEEFLEDLEENPELRFNISLYRNKEYQQPDVGPMGDGENVPSVPLEELLADLDISDE